MKRTLGFDTSAILFIVFLVLKLTHQITWSWWWITAPIWIPGLIILGLSAVLFTMFFVKKGLI